MNKKPPLVLLMMSGGADSTFLFWQLLTQKIHFSVVHFNHNLRQKESDADALFVESLCLENNIRYNVIDLNLKQNHNLQNEARLERYKNAIALAQKWQCSHIATAHHFDDQIETLIMRKMRGSGLTGFCGIQNHLSLNKISIWRPILQYSKHDIITWLKDNNKIYREDSSNFKLNYHRNRIRHTLGQMPSLELSSIKESTEFLKCVNTYFNQRLSENFPLTQLRSSLPKALVQKLTPELQFRALKTWLKSKGVFLQWNKKLLSLFLNTRFSRQFKQGTLIVDKKTFFFLKQKIPTNTTRILNLGAYYFGARQLKIVITKTSQSPTFSESQAFYINKDIEPPWLVSQNEQQSSFLAFNRRNKKTVNQILKEKKIPEKLRQHWPVLIDKSKNMIAVLGIEIAESAKNQPARKYIFKMTTHWPYTVCKQEKLTQL